MTVSSLIFWSFESSSELSFDLNLAKVLAAKFSSRFFEIQMNSDDLVVLYDSRTGYRLKVSSQYEDNAITEDGKSGAGQLSAKDGWKVLLYFSVLNSSIKSGARIKFSDEDGVEILMNDWHDLKSQLCRLGIDAEEVRKDAEFFEFAEPDYVQMIRKPNKKKFI